MAKKQNTDFFWLGFSDLMTTLFFIMLVLFVVTVVYLKQEKDIAETTAERLQKIIQLDQQFKLLENDDDFIYLEECKKFIVKDFVGEEIFEPNKAIIKSDFIQQTIQAGSKVDTFLNQLQQRSNDFSYLLVIEGNVANSYDNKFSPDSEYGYKKSYERALAVYNLWLENDISFRKDNVEVLIAGSGFNGLCREDVEDNNKRFSIQIIPKVATNINIED